MYFFCTEFTYINRLKLIYEQSQLPSLDYLCKLKDNLFYHMSLLAAKVTEGFNPSLSRVWEERQPTLCQQLAILHKRLLFWILSNNLIKKNHGSDVTSLLSSSTSPRKDHKILQTKEIKTVQNFTTRHSPKPKHAILRILTS